MGKEAGYVTAQEDPLRSYYLSGRLICFNTPPRCRLANNQVTVLKELMFSQRFSESVCSVLRLKSAMESPNWDVPMGYKYAVDRECNAWIKQKVLQGTSWDQIKQDLHALNMRLLFTIKTDKKNCFQRAKLRILILGHQYAVKQGEHYFENYSQTVRWPNIRAICAQACINGFTYAKQIDTGAAFLFEANELGTQVLVRVPKELGDILGCGELAFCLKAAYGLPSAPRAFFNFVKRTLSNPNGCNLTQSRQDEAVFFRVEGDEYIFVGTWVDDFLVIGNSKRLYDKFYQHYKIAVDDAIDEADLDFMLGVNFTVDYENQTINPFPSPVKCA